jgi:hypothetical protein
MLKVIGMGDEDELEESYRVFLRAPCCVDKTILLLPISEIRVTSGDSSSSLRNTRIKGHEIKY